jgi:hypothetical protein
MDRKDIRAKRVTVTEAAGPRELTANSMTNILPDIKEANTSMDLGKEPLEEPLSGARNKKTLDFNLRSNKLNQSGLTLPDELMVVSWASNKKKGRSSLNHNLLLLTNQFTN